MAGLYPDDEVARQRDREIAPVPSGLEAYARIEGLVGEEDELREQVEKDEKKERRERLHEIEQELDRAWETLRRRAERRAK